MNLSLSRKALLLLISLAAVTPILGNPTGGQVAGGSAKITGQGSSTVTINQTSNTAIINWQTFSIGGNELTQFVQPNANSAVLNRVLGGQTSVIDGTLSANGQVYLINGNGILIGAGGVVNTAGFTASTRDISDSDFLSRTLHFSGTGDGGVQNLGTITALGGNVVLIGKTVDNQGAINAAKGTVGLVAGDDVLLAQKNADGSTITVNPTAAPSNASSNIGVHNSGTITAAAAELKAANGNIYALAIQNEGVIRATTVKNQGGHIWLTSDSGTIVNTGTLDASATAARGKGGSVTMKNMGGLTVDSGAILAKGGQGGAGGKAEVSGEKVELTGTVDLTAPGGTTGDLLLDPSYLEVIIGGTGYVSGGTNDTSDSTIDPNTIDAALSSADVILDADYGITITDGISWATPTTLTIKTNYSGSDIQINAPISGAAGGLTINTGGASDPILPSSSGSVNVARFILQSGSWQQTGGTLPAFTASNDFELQGGTFLRAANGDGSTGNPYQITDIYGLQGIGSPSGSLLGNSFVQNNDIDANGTVNWNSGAGFVPIGNQANSFDGSYDGQGYAITGLTINLPTQNYLGLFGNADGTIQNAALVGGSITGQNYIGALVGVLGNNSTLMGSHSSAAVTGGTNSQEIGGLVGSNSGLVQNCYATGTVSGDASVGGLIGANGGTVNLSYATGAVTGEDFVGEDPRDNDSNAVGGLIGSNSNTVEMSYATGAVSGLIEIGGLIGLNSGGSSVQTSYAAGKTTGPNDSSFIGGLVGLNYGTIQMSYANEAVVGGIASASIGGLVGDNAATVETSYARGSISVGMYAQNVGGLVGLNQGAATIETSYTTDTLTSVSNTPQFDVGGLVGDNIYGTVKTSYWAANAGGSPSALNTFGDNSGTVDSYTSGKQLSDLSLQTTYQTAGTTLPGWDFTLGTGVWGINGQTNTGFVNNGLPYFQWQHPTQAIVTANNQILTYSGTSGTLDQNEYQTTFAPGYSDLAPLLASAPVLSVIGDNVNVYNYPISFPTNTVGLSLTPNAGYTIEILTQPATVTYSPKPITVATLTGSVSKTYDGTNAVNITDAGYDTLTLALGSTDILASDSSSVELTASYYTYGQKDVGTNLTVTANGLTLTGDSHDNYTLVGGLSTVDESGAGTITPRSIGVAVKAGTSVYGANDSGLTPGLTVTGLVSGDAVSDLGYTSGITGTANQINSTTDAGSYKLTIGGSLTDSDYVLQAGDLSPAGKATTWKVAADILTVSGLTGTSIYGQTPTTPANPYTITSSNGVTDQATLLDLINGAPITTAYTFNITDTTNAGKFNTDKITSKVALASGVNTKDYTLKTVAQGAWTVTPDLITIAGAINGSSTYGFATGFDGANYFTVSDQDDNGNVDSFIKGAGATLSASATSNAGTYAVKTAGSLNVVSGQVNGVASGNYKVVLTAGSWVIDPQAVVITIGSGTSVYGAAPKAPTLTATGSVNGKSVNLTSSLLKGFSTDQLTVIGKTGNSGVGNYSIDLTGTATGNYTYTGADLVTTATWTVTPATITALTVNTTSTAIYGANPVDSALKVSGLVNGDKADALGYVLVASGGNLVAGTNVSDTPYAFTVGGSLTDGNYTLKTGLANPVGATGSVTVNPAALTVTALSGSSNFGNDPTYGSATGDFGLTFAGLYSGDASLESDFSETPVVDSSTVAGSYAIKPVSNLIDANYTVKLVAGKWTVKP